jgi:hypothetical protein
MSCFYYMLGKLRALSIVLYVSYVFFNLVLNVCPIYLRGRSAHHIWYTPLKLYLSAVLLFTLKWCFILFCVLNNIPTSVFLNNLVIVLVSGLKYVKVAHFLLC